MKKTIIAILSTLLLAQAAYAENVCKIDDPEDAVRCKRGETILYKIGIWTSLAKPLEFVAHHCDMDKYIKWDGNTLLCVSAGKKKVIDRTEEDSDKKDD